MAEPNAVIYFLVVPLAIFAGLWLLGLAFTFWINARFPQKGQTIAVDGAALNVLDLPGPDEDCPTLVLIHGASGTLRDPLNAIGTELAKRFRIVLIDRPGQGHSRRFERSMASPARQADAMAEVLVHLKIDKAIIVGHSWGGAVAAAFGVNHPDKVAGIAFISPVTYPWPGGIDLRNTFGAIPIIGPILAAIFVVPTGSAIFSCALSKVFGPNSVPENYRELAGALLALKPAAFVANCQDVADLFDNLLRLSVRYDEIKAPVEIVTGDQDAILAPFIHSYGLARDIGGAKLTVLPGVGHMPHWSARDDVISAIDRVVARTKRREAHPLLEDAEDRERAQSEPGQEQWKT